MTCVACWFKPCRCTKSKEGDLSPDEIGAPECPEPLPLKRPKPKKTKRVKK